MKKIDSKLGFFIKRRPIVWIILLAIVIFGLNAATSLPQELQPEVKIPIVSVVTIMPGASPTDTETLITKELEKEYSSLDNIKHITSTSAFNSSIIILEFDAKSDMDQALQDTKDATDTAKTNLPEDAENPVVKKAKANDISVLTYTLTGNVSLEKLTKISKTVKEEMENVRGLSDVNLFGEKEEKIIINVDKQKADSLNIGLSDISKALKYSNANIPIGIINTQDLNYSLRIDNTYTSIEEIKNTPLFSAQDTAQTTIKIQDIANVQQKFKENSIINTIAVANKKSQNAISMQIFKSDNTSIAHAAIIAKDKITELQKNGTIPSNVDLILTNDNSAYIKEDLGNLISNGIQTTFLIIFILFLALGFRQGIIAGLSIPVTFMIALGIMKMAGMTLNSLSLFSLVIALGLMVDTTIVIMEAIHENMRNGYSKENSALLAIQTYKWPLIAGTLTTIFAFFPMLLVSGILGQFLRTLPITISATLLGSLFVSLIIAPSIATKFIRHTPKKSLLEPFFDKIGNIFEKIIHSLVSKKILRSFIIFITLILFVGSLAMPITGFLKVEMFPKTDQNFFVVQVETKKGINISETEKIIKEVESKIRTLDNVDNFMTLIGTDTSIAMSQDIIDINSGSVKTNKGSITVNLIDKESREVKSYDIADKLRSKIKNIKNADITVVELTEGPPSDSPISIKVTGNNMKEIERLAKEVIKITQSIDGTINTKLSTSPGLNEFKFTLKQEELSKHMLSTAFTAMEIRNQIQGIENATATINDEDLDIQIKYNFKETSHIPELTITEIENFEIKSPKGYKVKFGEIAEFKMQESLSKIDHEDERRVLKIKSDIEKDANSVEITKQIEAAISTLEIPDGYEVKFGGDYEDIAESFRDLFKSMGVGLILITFTLVLMFNSFRQPLIILMALPLSLIGVFPGLKLIGLNLSFPAFLGVVALAGIVVNDAIVLIDKINTNIADGIAKPEAIAKAANARLQPIIMTSLTTIVGIIPLALTNKFWAGLGFSLIFGLTFSTILTLIIIPIIYQMVVKKK